MGKVAAKNKPDSSERPAPHRTRLYVLLGLAMLAVLLLLGCQIWLSYQEDIREAKTKTRNYVSILEARLDATLRRSDAILQGLALTLPKEALSQQAVPRFAKKLNAELDIHMFNFEELQATVALRASENQLKLQFEHMPVGCIVWGKDFVVPSWNPAAESIFGYSEAEAAGCAANKLIVPKEAEPDVKAVWQRLALGDDAVYSLNRNVTKDGALITCEWINAPFTDREGNISGAVSMVQDVTSRLEHEKEQLKMEKLESLGVLAGGIAHDFNNILTGIIGNISFAQMFLEGAHKASKPLAEAAKASLRAGELARQLLTFARGGDPQACLIVSSGYSNDPIMSDFRKYGFCGAVAKPYTAGDFGEMLSSLLVSR